MAPTCGLSRDHAAPVTGELVPSLNCATVVNCCVEGALLSDWIVTDAGEMASPVSVRLLMTLESEPPSPVREASGWPTPLSVVVEASAGGS